MLLEGDEPRRSDPNGIRLPEVIFGTLRGAGGWGRRR